MFIVRGPFLIVIRKGMQSLWPIALNFYVRCIRILLAKGHDYE